jgi:circadian clock protein KaiB
MSQPREADDTTVAAASGEHWDLCLYVTGQSPKCLRAIENLRHACEEHLAGRYQLEIIDLLENPRLAAEDQILAVPTVVRRLPMPVRKLVGDLSDAERLLIDLQVPLPGSRVRDEELRDAAWLGIGLDVDLVEAGEARPGPGPGE